MLDQHMLVVIIALSTQAQAPTGVQVHRPERSGVGFARHEWFSPLLLVHFLSCSLSSLANLCWASCMSGEGRRLQTVLLSTINIKTLIRCKRSKGHRGLTPRLQLVLALVFVLCAHLGALAGGLPGQGATTTLRGRGETSCSRSFTIWAFSFPSLACH